MPPASNAAGASRSKLASYRAKRDFSKTREPSGDRASHAAGHSYLTQKHAASRLHYDFRLELGGVLKSWAVTKGPSLNPEDKRLAVHVEDHPLDYGSFEGTIPQGEYGGGTVMLWDLGTWEPIGNPERDLARGNLTFLLHGNLADHVQVKGASFENGLLMIDLVREIPEAMKPRRIAINGSNVSSIETKKAA